MVLKGCTKPHERRPCGGHSTQVANIIDQLAPSVVRSASEEFNSDILQLAAAIAKQDRFFCMHDAQALMSLVYANLGVLYLSKCLSNFRTAHAGSDTGEGDEATRLAVRELCDALSYATDEAMSIGAKLGPVELRLMVADAEGKTLDQTDYEPLANRANELCAKVSKLILKLYSEA